MPNCIICRTQKSQFVVFHAPSFQDNAPLNARTVAHSACTDCVSAAQQSGNPISACPVCRAPVDPQLYVTPMLVHEPAHKCSHMFAVRNAAGVCDASSFSFCGSACGTAAYCHHHNSADFVEVPPAPHAAAGNHGPGASLTLDEVWRQGEQQHAAMQATASQLSGRRLQMAQRLTRITIASRSLGDTRGIEVVRDALEFERWIEEQRTFVLPPPQS